MRRTAALALLLALLAACGDDDELTVDGGVVDERFADYCKVVEEQQKPLTEALAKEGATGLLDALPSFRALREESPRDIADDWDLIVGRTQTLVDALEAADVDPATYDREQPPPGLSDEERTAIDAAANELATPATVAALEGVQQQARDVCKMPMSF